MEYKKEYRRKVLEKAVVGYSIILLKVKEGQTGRNRKGPETLLRRRFKRLLGSQE